MHLLYHSNNFWKAPWRSSCVSMSMTFVTASFMELSDWCIVLVEMPLIRFEECWPLPTESLPELPLKPQHTNPNRNLLANQLWSYWLPYSSPHLSSPLTNSLPSLEPLMPLKNWCSIHARCSKSSLKHSIRFCGIFSKFKTQFYCISFF